MEEQDKSPRSPLGPIALIWVVAVIVLNWLFYVLPGIAALTAGFELPLATGTTLAVASVEPAGGTMLLSMAVAAASVVAVLVVMAARATTPKERAPRSPILPVGAVAVLAAVALPMEWCLGGLQPDLFSVGPLLAVAAILGVVVPLGLLVASIRLTGWMLTAARRNAFFGGIVATLGTILLAPPAAAAASLFLLVQAVDAASNLPPPAPAPIERVAAPAPAPVGGGFGLLGVAPGTSDSDLDACLRELERIRGQVEQMLQSRYTVSYADAEDIASDAMVSVCLSDSLSSYSNLQAVYTQAAKNKAVDVLRKRRGEVGVEPALCLPFYPDEWRLPSELVIVDEALGRLDGTTRDALHLWSQSESHRTIAYRLGITERQSRDLVGNGLKSMRKYTAERCAYRGASSK